MSERSIQGQSGVWVELTENDVTRLRVQNQSGYGLHVKRGGASAPSSTDGSILLNPNDIFFETIADLWPGGTGARVWAYSKNSIQVSVSHE